MSNQPYKVNLIGCGRIGYSFEKNKSSSPLSHFSAIMSNSSFNLTAVCDTNRKVLQEIKSANKEILTYSDNLEMVKEHHPDIIVIASPDETHVKMIIDSLEVSPKIIFVEKPLVRNFAEHQQLTNSLNNNVTKLVVNFSRRFNPMYEEIFHDTRVSKIIIKFSGTLIHNGIHFFDLILKRFGEPESINKLTSDLLLFTYKSNLNVIFINIQDVNASVEEIEIYLKNERYLISNNKQIKQKKIEDPAFNGFYIFGNDQDIEFNFQDELKNAYCYIIELLEKPDDCINELIHNKNLLKIIFDNEK